MTTNVDRLADFLFPAGEDSKVVNIKFTPGNGRSVSAEEIAAQILSADEQIASGRATLVTDVDDFESRGIR